MKMRGKRKTRGNERVVEKMVRETWWCIRNEWVVGIRSESVLGIRTESILRTGVCVA